jgi:hypothetical protein
MIHGRWFSKISLKKDCKGYLPLIKQSNNTNCVTRVHHRWEHPQAGGFPILEPQDDSSMLVIMMYLASLHRENAGWSIGGSRQFARAIEHC